MLPLHMAQPIIDRLEVLVRFTAVLEQTDVRVDISENMPSADISIGQSLTKVALTSSVDLAFLPCPGSENSKDTELPSLR